ncbi:hypothetical protein LC612_34315 [Nostoc sp. CHAB 5834]|nr:hypothetical protein [Nostoc sp. CHAB 5834]
MTERIKENWFWPLAAALWAIAFLGSRNVPTPKLAGWEIAVIVDVMVTMPALFALCYRTKFTWQKMAIRILALQCLGIWLATKIVPVETQKILLQLSWLRYVGLAVLVMIELRIMAALFRLVFKADTSSKDLEQIGMPPILARVMLLEARFWRWVFSFFKR